MILLKSIPLSPFLSSSQQHKMSPLQEKTRYLKIPTVKTQGNPIYTLQTLADSKNKRHSDSVPCLCISL